MTTQIKRRRGTTLQHSTFAGAEAEITIDTDKNTVVVHDGSTAGGHPLAKASEIVAKAGDTMTGDLSFGDNNKALFGAASDLRIYHDGFNSYIDETGTGTLRIRGYNEVRITDTSDSAAAIFKSNAETTLYHSNSPKLATTSTGVDVTGTITSDALTVDGDTTTDGLDLAAIAASKADTAVDVFVYDTSKDSDGGAWRKRTQATSWYNETLNTATRGSRREFPAVAVIVAESNQVTIYDGDDPDLPMWMVFSTISNSILRGSANDVSCVTMGQAQMLVGGIDTAGIYQIDFLLDRGTRWSSAHTTNTGVFHLTIAERSGVAPISIAQSPDLLVNGTINDVAMTVLPNAPIDPATGLPVPTIAVATDGGVSVIKDDGTVVDDTTFSPINVLSFSIDNDVFFGRNGFGRVYKWDYSADTSSTATYVTNATNPPLAGTTNGGIVDFGNDEYWASGGNTDGLNVFAENKLAANITSDFNTGWMNGDIKGAFLSDTDDTDLVGSGELVTNGTFDTDTSGWSSGNGTIAVASGKLQITSGGSGNGYAYQAITTEVGKVYVVSADYTDDTGTNALMWVGTTVGGGQTATTTFTTTGSYNLTFTATATTHYIRVGANEPTASLVYLFDNISVRLAEEDRSVNGNGLQVFGTVTRTPVATGADLVAYSGFSTSNYLEQPYNSDLDFGTGDFCIMGWVKVGDTSLSWILDTIDASNTEGFALYKNDDGTVVLRTRNGNNTSLTSATSIESGTWRFITATVTSSGTTLSLYIDGVLNAQAAGQVARSIGGTDGPLILGGRNQSPAAPINGSLALWRISATAPSPEQIKKIYEDEKVLFQEGAQATLYGASDAVTALAHDSDTGLLHVGTSAGRSVFQGLRRVSNTTTAVGTAISASNGLVVEE